MANEQNIDIKLIPDTVGNFDIAIKDGDFESVQGLDTAIYTSLFTDGRAPAYNVPDSFRRRGWIGNIGTSKFPTSLLWLLDQSRITQNTLNLAKQYTNESLRWLIDEKIAQTIEVQISREYRGIGINITLLGFNDEANRFYVLWQKTGRT